MTEKSHPSSKSDSKPELEFPFFSMLQANSWWAPYRAMAHMMGQAERNVALMVQTNRKLADSLREIVRREQDTLLNLTDKMMHELSDNAQKKNGDAAPSLEIYQTAMEGARDFGQAMVDAQAESLEAVREYTQAAIEAGRQSVAEIQTAA